MNKNIKRIKMKIEFKNITKCSKELYEEFLAFHQKKYGTKQVLKNICIVIGILFLIAFNIAYNTKYVIFIISFCLIGAYLFYLYKRSRVVEKELKSSKIKNEEEITYIFYKWCFDIIKNNKKERVFYYRVKRIHQDENNFYLYLDDTHALAVNKNGFVIGNVNDFDKFLSKKFIIKYKKYDKKKNKKEK